MGASGAITVSPFDLQVGAKKIAAVNNIAHVRLTPDSTANEFQMQFLNHINLSFHDVVTATVTDRLTLTITDTDGTRIEDV
ncbi:hypothetical protein [Burkholderia sp. Ac-20344]|uniref:hypothetical protein n=1 Tax=Burkholderia sp. Ac-20344 TaxID=2703890 RepID=UPI00197C6D11|nr:hypothetical protein [Burkholderia sp. Ac-20344]MBN3836312.1 hypothetical protein [Burkholderia sp. Ac-20344]